MVYLHEQLAASNTKIASIDAEMREMVSRWKPSTRELKAARKMEAATIKNIEASNTTVAEETDALWRRC